MYIVDGRRGKGWLGSFCRGRGTGGRPLITFSFEVCIFIIK